MLRSRIPDIFLGAILGIATLGFAIFAMGFVLGSSQYSGQPTQSQGPEKTNGSESNNEQQEPWWQRAATDPIAVFTLCLVLVGAFQVGLFYVQLKIIRDSLVDAKTTANAAKLSADSLRNIERAYVFIDYELLRERNEALKAGGIFNKQIALVFKNFGRTPAIVNGINCKCHRWQNRYLPPMEPNSIKIPSGIAIGSSSPWSIPAFFEGTECDINDANSGDGSIYLYGKITYLDMLGEQRETGFCCEWNFAEGQFFMAPNTELNYHT